MLKIQLSVFLSTALFQAACAAADTIGTLAAGCFYSKER
jgi:hypothetical protein